MNNKLVLIALFAVFFAPVLVAIVLHSEWVSWQAAPDKAHGELVEPVVPLGEFELPDAAGRTRTPADLTGRWQLVHARPGGCGDACVETVSLMHNIRLAQDRHRDDVGLVLLTGAELEPATRERLAEFDASLVAFDGEAGEALLQRFPALAPGAFYIVDPEANIMERFGPGANLNGIRKDLDRLLTWTVREQQ
jgi:hypothetical protein